MEDLRPHRVSIDDAIAALTFLPDRTPTSTAEQSAGAFSQLTSYRDGGIFVGHWAGTTEWERHGAGEEIVMVIDGDTTIYFSTDGGEQAADLRAGQLVIVPQGTWHRFETPNRVTLLSVTPQPTDHTVNRPT
jgi:mannose-6-phosphate isomerase-like protein (cupin superfamily)